MFQARRQDFMAWLIVVFRWRSTVVALGVGLGDDEQFFIDRISDGGGDHGKPSARALPRVAAAAS
jgi:hypothetical protein